VLDQKHKHNKIHKHARRIPNYDPNLYVHNLVIGTGSCTMLCKETTNTQHPTPPNTTQHHPTPPNTTQHHPTPPQRVTYPVALDAKADDRDNLGLISMMQYSLEKGFSAY
jgi:hypothetical protein